MNRSSKEVARSTMTTLLHDESPELRFDSAKQEDHEAASRNRKYSQSIEIQPPHTNSEALSELVRSAGTYRHRLSKEDVSHLKTLKHEQHPDVLLLTCADSRIVPHEILSAKAGVIFELRNAGNIVSPFNPEIATSEAASIEYAIKVIGISHIIVMGHSDCGAMKALLHAEKVRELTSVSSWLQHAHKATERVVANGTGLSEEQLLDATIKENVLLQIENLKTIPCVAEALAEGKLNLHGWIYHVHNGRIVRHNFENGSWKAL